MSSVGQQSPRLSQDTEAGDQITMLKQEVAHLTAALERGKGASDGEIAKLRQANRVLEAHVDMLRSNLAAERSESAEQAAQSGHQSGRRRTASESEESTVGELRAELERMRSEKLVGLLVAWHAARWRLRYLLHAVPIRAMSSRFVLLGLTVHTQQLLTVVSLQALEGQQSGALSEDLSAENIQMAASNRQLQAQIQELQGQLQKAAALQADLLSARQHNAQLEQQNTDLQQQLQGAARAWGDKHRQHKEALSKAQAVGSEAVAENRRLLELLKHSEQVTAFLTAVFRVLH